MREDTRIRLMVIILDRGKGVRAAELFGNLPAVRQAEGIELFLRLVALFSSDPDQDG